VRLHRAAAVAGIASFLVAVSLPAHAYLTASAHTSLVVGAASLSAPEVTVTAGETAITLDVAAGSGPVPTAYTVTRGSFTCALTGPGSCTESGLTSLTAYTYTVTARLGTHWQGSRSVVATTSPPTVTLKLSNGSDTGYKGDGLTRLVRPTFTITAPRRPATYTVEVFRGTGSGPVSLGTRTIASGSGNHTTTLTTPLSAAFPATLDPPPNEVYALAYVAASGPTTRSNFAPSPGLRVWPTPTVTDLALANGAGATATADEGDTVTFVFSQPMLPSSLCESWDDVLGDEYSTSVTARIAEAGSADSATFLTDAGVCGEDADTFFLGIVGLGADYATSNVDFADSTVTLDPTWKMLTITLGPPDVSGTTGVTYGAPSFTPATPLPRDQAGSSFTGPFVAPGVSGF
jgi:hypothetical protein